MLVAAPTNSHNLISHACEYNHHDFHGRTINVASIDKTKLLMCFFNMGRLKLYA